MGWSSKHHRVTASPHCAGAAWAWACCCAFCATSVAIFAPVAIVRSKRRVRAFREKNVIMLMLGWVDLRFICHFELLSISSFVAFNWPNPDWNSHKTQNVLSLCHWTRCEKGSEARFSRGTHWPHDDRCFNTCLANTEGKPSWRARMSREFTMASVF